ncbi:MAG: hypothetical protein EPN23_05740 [Verrucomicrobia bacterium]|nr:MAG: hypothetical protein EPN23_05740 [Verrucomicrobiota bacterium]
MRGHWEHFEHKADIDIRGWGITPAAAFAPCALALTAVITDLKTIVPRTPRVSRARSPNSYRWCASKDARSNHGIHGTTRKNLCASAFIYGSQFL